MSALKPLSMSLFLLLLASCFITHHLCLPVTSLLPKFMFIIFWLNLCLNWVLNESYKIPYIYFSSLSLWKFSKTMPSQSSPDFVGTEVEWVLEVRVWWQFVHHLLCPCWRFGGLPPDHGLSLHWWFWRYSWHATPKCKPLIELAWCPGSKSNFLRSRTFHTQRLGALYRALRARRMVGGDPRLICINCVD